MTDKGWLPAQAQELLNSYKSTPGRSEVVYAGRSETLIHRMGNHFSVRRLGPGPDKSGRQRQPSECNMRKWQNIIVKHHGRCRAQVYYVSVWRESEYWEADNYIMQVSRESCYARARPPLEEVLIRALRKRQRMRSAQMPSMMRAVRRRCDAS